MLILLHFFIGYPGICCVNLDNLIPQNLRFVLSFNKKKLHTMI